MLLKEATIAGEGCTLVLRVSGYERPHLETGADANWLRAEAVLEAASSGSFHGRHHVSLRTEELAEFRGQLAQLLQTLSGEAVLTHMEDLLGCAVRLKFGVGEMEAFLRDHVGAELRTHARTDQSYLGQTLAQLDSLVAAFPIKGDALG